MTQVDFYILEQRTPGNRYTLTCRLSEKIYHQGRRIFIHTGSEEVSRHMNRLLWTFRQGSFIPHGMADDCDLSVTPVIISHQGETGEEKDVLINLDSEVPSFFSRFERVAEIVDQEPQVIVAGRKRFRFYRDRGYSLNKHDIG
ncbi:MAG: DNA polymerase III subunit chi [Candidatus Thiodiazotropha sp. (ex Epidulcina cf. delphinae)]|nr:DNA polymerase III subunit chi [Candidatus Thiodiazotropha sp. (ex Epidulcina cf. delphinae)]